ncbi:DUF3073 domain-containing protein [Cellulomonas hominis]|jgi:hypothetical protein|uniref:DUF3073 domain-containing protein n=1 Tax=Cellulomonas hominis TaxID=156981 RepID=A0A511F7E5_9CELL|nr:DUF3073 domain-containing protein [Cellulomonas hominis]MBU5421434.1 DUF3073 domain-containing protein [Cellulomonas hominis]NKY10347.1 DUF3073 family protein [Cellulomonas hominis]GEL45211.1 hypothetical protein CHO01_03270 [Cellulomonas hominis]
MGRGRQKAKQTKVARELKYFSPDTNYRALEQELTGRGNDFVRDSRQDSDDEGDEYPPRWADER